MSRVKSPNAASHRHRQLEAKLDRMLETRRRNPANHRLARHLEHERLWLFTFLHCPGLDATTMRRNARSAEW